MTTRGKDTEEQINKTLYKQKARSWADPEGGQNLRTPPPHEKSQNYRVY